MPDPAIDAKLALAAEVIRKSEERAVAGQLALEMIHEIKNPLEALGHLVFLTLAESRDHEQVEKYMRMAQEQMETLRHVASQTLGFARPVSTLKEIEALALADAALRIHQRTIDEKRIHLVRELPDDVRAHVYTGEMLQVLSNLIVNALDALPSGGTLRLRVREGVDRLYFVIADNGHGIPAENLSRLFQPFFSTKGERGNGFGLALTRRIVERHRGTIGIRSSVRPGRSGTVIRIAIPATAPFHKK